MTVELPPSDRNTPCCLCGQRHFQLLGATDRRGEPLHTVICTTCGLVSHETIPSEEELTAFYADDYRLEYQRSFAPKAHRVLRAWELGEALVAKLRPWVKAGGHVYEVGAGLGATVKQFERAGFSAAGNEPNHGYREFGRTQLAARLEPGTLNDLPQQPSYDLVILHHVLEHLPQPRQSLEHIRRLLRLGGVAYVEVPNVAAPHAAPGKMFHYAHIFNFTPGTLTALAAAAGLTVKQALTKPTDETIGYVLTPDGRAAVNIDYADNYRRAVEGITRYSAFGYYARPTYLAKTVGRSLRLLADRVGAKSRLQKVLAACRDAAPQESSTRARAA